MSDDWPEPDEYVIGTVTRIAPYGAYLRLEEYGGREGFIHVSEISSSWVRNIRNFLREGQRTVAKVVRVDEKKGHVDLSLRRASESDRRRKLLEWKKGRKEKALMSIFAEKLGKDPTEVHKRYSSLLEEKFGSIYDGFEEVARRGIKALDGVRLDDRTKRVLTQVAEENVRPRKAKVVGRLQISCYKPNGVEVLREAIRRAERIGDVKVQVVGCPNFRIEAVGEDYKKVDELLRKAATVAIEYAQREGGQGSFSKETKK
ncbi:MAG: translation initiation factor IF-2 subunit alpha [Candidatus Bathyarchaeia archaeon]